MQLCGTASGGLHRAGRLPYGARERSRLKEGDEMRLVIVTIGWILVALGVGVLCHDLVKWLLTGNLAIIDAGSFWFAVHETSLKLAEPAVARYVHPWLWHPVISTILLAPTFVVIGLPGAVLLLLARRRRYSGHGELFKG